MGFGRSRPSGTRPKSRTMSLSRKPRSLSLMRSQSSTIATWCFRHRSRRLSRASARARSHSTEPYCKRCRSEQRRGQKFDPLPNWTLHDLRRTAKTLMVRAGVRPDISERVLGHVIAGVEGTYDRHSYAEEKRDALEKLAAIVNRVLHPPRSNVVKLDRAALSD